METVQKNRGRTGRNVPAPHRPTGEIKQTAPRAQINAGQTITINGLLPMWSGPTKTFTLQDRFFQSLTLACKDAAVTTQFFPDEPFPRNLIKAFRAFKATVMPDNKCYDFDYCIVPDGKDMCRVMKYYMCCFSDPCLIPLEQVYAMKEEKEKVTLVNMVLSTFAYLYQVAKIDGCDQYNYMDGFYDMAKDCLEPGNSSYDRQVRKFCKQARVVAKRMSGYLTDPLLLQNWEKHINAFTPSSKQEIIYKDLCCNLYQLYRQFPNCSIRTGWLTGGEECCDEDFIVYPENIFTFFYMGNILHPKIRSGLTAPVEGYLRQVLEDHVNCSLNESMYGLIYDKGIVYAPGEDTTAPDFAFQKKFHELVYDLSFELRELL